MNEDYLCHHGVKGMKWGRRKQKVSSGVKKTGSKKISNKQKKTLSKANKEKVKKVAKTAAVVAGSAAAATALAAIGSIAYKNYVDSHMLGPVASGYIAVNGKRRYF